MEASVRLLFYVRTEFIIVIQNILALIAMAGKDIRDQRLRIRNNQGILKRHPFYLAKILSKDIPAIFAAKPLIQLIRGQHDSFMKCQTARCEYLPEGLNVCPSKAFRPHIQFLGCAFLVGSSTVRRSMETIPAHSANTGCED